jgi:hypothetical protein
MYNMFLDLLKEVASATANIRLLVENPEEILG